MTTARLLIIFGLLVNSGSAFWLIPRDLSDCLISGLQCTQDCSSIVHCTGNGVSPKTVTRCPQATFCSTQSGTPECDAAICINSAWEPVVPAADPPTCTTAGQKLPDPEDCHKYYICTSATGPAESKICDEGTYYNSTTLICEDGDCTNIVTTTTESTTTVSTTEEPTSTESTTTESTTASSTTDSTTEEPTSTESSTTESTTVSSTTEPTSTESTTTESTTTESTTTESTTTESTTTESTTTESTTTESTTTESTTTESTTTESTTTESTTTESTTTESTTTESTTTESTTTESTTTESTTVSSTTDSTTTESTTTEPSTSTEPTTPQPPQCTSINQKFPDPVDCHSYFVCNATNVDAIHKTCPNNTYYNQNLLGCVRGNCSNGIENQCTDLNLKFPDPTDCTKYYICTEINKPPVPKDCPPNTYYDVKRQGCVRGTCTNLSFHYYLFD